MLTAMNEPGSSDKETDSFASTTPLLLPEDAESADPKAIKYKYRDFSNVEEDDEATIEIPAQVPSRGSSESSIRVQKFPVKLYTILAQKEFHDIISWMPHGRSWKVLKPSIFETLVMPLFFEYSNYHSFNRLVNAWSFRRATSGPDRGSYYHEFFLRGKPHLQKYMRRLPKTHKKLPMIKEDEPNFYLLDEVNPLPALADAPIPTLAEGGALRPKQNQQQQQHHQQHHQQQQQQQHQDQNQYQHHQQNYPQNHQQNMQQNQYQNQQQQQNQYQQQQYQHQQNQNQNHENLPRQGLNSVVTPPQGMGMGMPPPRGQAPPMYSPVGGVGSNEDYDGHLPMGYVNDYQGGPPGPQGYGGRQIPQQQQQQRMRQYPPQQYMQQEVEQMHAGGAPGPMGPTGNQPRSSQELYHYQQQMKMQQQMHSPLPMYERPMGNGPSPQMTSYAP